MKGNLREVMEIRTEIEGEAYRAIYVAKLEGVIYGLHAFTKKATRGRKTPKHHLELIAQRLKVAKEDYAQAQKRRKKW